MSNLPDAEDLFMNVSIYESFNFNIDDLDAIDKIIYEHELIDCYCIDCKKESTFHFVTPRYSYPINALGKDKTGSIHESQEETDKRVFKSLTTEGPYYINITYKCSRNKNHELVFIIMINGTRLIKIGQYPSIADFEGSSLKKYQKILGNDKYRELSRGIGLASHGVGIGSFVYLRRIFEYLIELAHQEATEHEVKFEDDVYNSKRMDERILMLKNFLPEFLVENRNIYGILSKGVHELTEKSCLEIFPHVKFGIELILDEQLFKIEKKSKVEKAKQKIRSIAQQLKE
ncbi:hypothetical protein [Radiobacillus sp. PE A8.2]|uniref:hypothetical protein n=1 Tax=Radiobacillus sp. PE A8.2 TaxID=3380349 RepID=UPI00388F51E8